MILILLFLPPSSVCLIHIPVVYIVQTADFQNYWFSCTILIKTPFKLQKEFVFKNLLLLRYQDNIEFTGFVLWGFFYFFHTHYFGH